MANQTPTPWPWRVGPEADYVLSDWTSKLPAGSVVIWADHPVFVMGQSVAATFSRENAELIVRAVNAYDALVTALEDLTDSAKLERAVQCSSTITEEEIARAEAALRLARNEETPRG